MSGGDTGNDFYPDPPTGPATTEPATPAAGATPTTTAATTPTTTTATSTPASSTTPTIKEIVQGQYSGPTLPTGATFDPAHIQDTAATTLDNNAKVGAGNSVTAAQGTTQQVDQNQFYQDANTYDAAQIGVGNAAQGNAAQLTAQQLAEMGNVEAAQGTVDPNSLVENQFKNIAETDVNGNGRPDFAEQALRTVDEQMAARGLGSSSIAAQAATQAVMESILPFASQNAANYQRMAELNLGNKQQAAIVSAQQKFQGVIANLNNQQQQELQNTQMRQQTLLSDQSMENAERQFNATSKNQTDQFFSGLAASIATNNATRADAMAQFNAKEQNAVEQFNAAMAYQRESFNAANQLVIDQSNVNWRRNINTANTAADNAANQTEAQNRLNISNWAMSALWQEQRDNASWAFTASENDESRAQNMALAALQRQTIMDQMDQESQTALMTAIGRFGINLLNNVSTP